MTLMNLLVSHPAKKMRLLKKPGMMKKARTTKMVKVSDSYQSLKLLPQKRRFLLPKNLSRLSRSLETLLPKDPLNKIFLELFTSSPNSVRRSTHLLTFAVPNPRTLTPTPLSQATYTTIGLTSRLLTTPLLGKEVNQEKSLNLWKVSMKRTSVSSTLRSP